MRLDGVDGSIDSDRFCCSATKRNIIGLTLGVEILINAANINFIVFSASWQTGRIEPLAHSLLTSVALAQSMSAIALTIVVYGHRYYATLDVPKPKHSKASPR